MTTTSTTTASKSNPPVGKLNIGPVYAAIWKRTSDKRTFYSVTFERRYRDSKGNWKSGNSFDTSDLLALSKLANMAHSEILALRNGEEE